MEPKKISFGFSKLSKKTNIISNNRKQARKVELIECVEGQSIKVKDAVEEVKQPLIIPFKDNQKNLLDRIRDAKRRETPLDQQITEPEDNRPDSELSIDELAAKQLLREAKDRLAKRNNASQNKVSILPLNHETPSLEGQTESTLEDYESVPISDYGLAILRGMGWKEGMAVGRNTSNTVSVSVPELRPKGLGLGATKVVQSEIPAKKPVDKDGNELILVKGAYAKLIAGGKKGSYCEVQGFDEEAGRVIVKVYPKEENLNVNEFMLIPVTRDEFSKGSKILNNAKYEEYLEISNKKLENYKIKQEHPQSKSIKQHDHSSDPEVYYSHSGHKDHEIKSQRRTQSSDSEDDKEKTSRGRTKSKYRDRSRSPSLSRHRSKKDKDQRRYDSSSDSDHSKKKSSKSSKSKDRDRSRDKSRSKHKKDKTHKSKHRRYSSSSDTDSKRDKRKKNKCKTRHRRNSSSSSNDRSYRSKK